MVKYDEEVVEMVFDKLVGLNDKKRSGVVSSDDVLESKESVLNDLEYVNGVVKSEVIDKVNNDFDVFLEENGVKELKWEEIDELRDKVWSDVKWNEGDSIL